MTSLLVSLSRRAHVRAVAPCARTCVQFFSSSTSPSSPSSSPSTRTPPSVPLETGWPARWHLLERNITRIPRMIEYQEQQLFSPSLSIVHHSFLHLILNAPQRVELDLCEFLVGAQHATQMVLQDTNSLEFAHFVNGKAPTAMPEVAKRMETYCTPNCFHQLQRNVKRTLDKHITIEALDVEVERAFLSKAGYARLMEDEYADELRGIRLNPKEIRARRLPEDATLERLQLLVEVHTRERQRRTSRGKEVLIVDQRCIYLSQFTSRVTTPEEIDWRLASIALRTKGKQVEISRTPIKKTVKDK